MCHRAPAPAFDCCVIVVVVGAAGDRWVGASGDAVGVDRRWPALLHLPIDESAVAAA